MEGLRVPIIEQQYKMRCAEEDGNAISQGIYTDGFYVNGIIYRGHKYMPKRMQYVENDKTVGIIAEGNLTAEFVKAVDEAIPFLQTERYRFGFMYRCDDE